MNRNMWNAYVTEHGPRSGAFLQSWEWGNFQEALGRKVIRRGDLKLWAGQFIESKLPFGLKYLYAPRGPLLGKEGLGVVAELARETGSVFARIEPETAPTDARFRKTANLQPAHTLILDLAKGPEAILAACHEKTRYNVRLAERKGVEIELNSTAFGDAWPLFAITGERGGFRLHDRDYYAAMLEQVQGDARASLAIARYDGQVIAANIMMDFGYTRTYLHGASSDMHRNVMAPYLLHMRLIDEACSLGMKSYDWWGVAPEDAPENHAWAGITRFKLGFGGERVNYPGTYDLVTDPLRYRLYDFVRKLRRK